MSFISQFLIFASDSSLILIKEYRKDVIEKNKDFLIKEVMKQNADYFKPYLLIKKRTHCFVIKRENVYFCATTSSTPDEINILEILGRFADIVRDFCGTVNEKVVRNNIVLIYEILEEFLVDGYVQVDTTEKMKPLIYNIPNSAVARSNAWDIIGANSDFEPVPRNASNQPIVRQKDEQSSTNRKKQIYLDFLEFFSIIVESDGSISKKQLVGKLTMKCFISGNHSIRLAFATNEENIMERMAFNEAVSRNRQDSKIINFPSPDGEMTILKYRLEGESIKRIPFFLKHAIKADPNSSRDLNLHLKIITNFPSPNAEATKVKVTIPVPKSTTSITQHLSGTYQSAHLDEGTKQLVWTLKKIPDKFELPATFRLINAMEKISSEVEACSSIGPALFEFEIANHTSSGLAISSLVVEDASDSETMRWIRYIVSSDTYVIKF